jgi:hypothetical protein
LLLTGCRHALIAAAVCTGHALEHGIALSQLVLPLLLLLLLDVALGASHRVGGSQGAGKR